MSGDSSLPASPLATAAEFVRRFPSMLKQGPAADPDELAAIMLEATSSIEGQVGRRLAPFTNLQETHNLFGVNPGEYGSEAPGVPLPWAGSLGASYANALGTTDLVRKCWLNEFAPRYPELWTYDVASITLRLSVGGSYVVNTQTLEGPWPDSGMMRFLLGTFAPEETTAVIVYSGGYTQAIPYDLRRACLWEAARMVALDVNPGAKPADVNLDEIEGAISRAIASFAR